MVNFKRNVLSVLVLAVFIILAAGSKIATYVSNFDLAESSEERANNNGTPYIEFPDGTRVEGEKVHYKSGFLTKNQIGVGDQKFKIAEVRGYKDRNFYYARFGDSNEFARRIVHGKINIYVRYVEVTTYTNNVPHSSMRTYFYMQMGDGEPFVVITSQKMIVEAVRDCPAALELADKTSKEIRKAVRADRHYMNSIFETYNKCGTH